MKYFIFSIALLGVIPGTVFLLIDRRALRLSIWGMILPVLAFDNFAINFMSRETYHGTSRGMEVSVIYLVALMILLAFTVKAGKLLSPLPEWGIRLFLLYFLLMLPSFSTAADKQVAFFELWKMTMVFISFLAAYYYLKYTENLDGIIYAFMMVLILNFFCIVKQHVVGTSQVEGLFPHQNSLAMYMNLLGMLFFSRYLNRRESLKTTLFLAGFLMATATLLRTYSRGSIASYPLAFLITTFVSMVYEFKTRKLLLIVPLLALTLAGTLLLLPNIVMRFTNAHAASANTRKRYANIALTMIAERPLIGQGLNNWSIKVNPPYTYSIEERIKNNISLTTREGIVETIYLLVGAECGLPCLLALLVWYGYYWWISLKLLKRLRNTPYFYIPAGLLGSLTAVYLQSCLEWVLKQQVNFLQLVIMFAMLSYLNVHWRKLKADYLLMAEQEAEKRQKAEQKQADFIIRKQIK